MDQEEKTRIDEVVTRETAKMKLVYNKDEKCLDPGNLKETEYKFNRHMNLPGGSAPEKEAFFEVRRQQAHQVFNEFEKLINQDKNNKSKGVHRNPEKIKKIKKIMKLRRAKKLEKHN